MIDTVVKETWLRVKARLQEDIGERFFKMWFERCSVLSLKRGVLSIGVPNLFIREWVEEHYGAVLNRLASDEIGAPVRISVKVDPSLFREMRKETERIEEVVDGNVDAVEGKTLDSYLVCSGNEMAVRALRHVSAGNEPPMNPLVVWGPDGVGKSHLASAMARLFAEGTSLYRVTGEEFARRFAWNLKTRKIDRFRDQVGGADALILDDAQDLAGKTATQREIANLAQDLKARGGQLIVFMDRHPKEIPELEEGFRSILLAGMLQSVEPPAEEDTIRILEGLLGSARRRIPREVIVSVVRRCGGSVKRLDRLVRKIYAFAGLTGEPVDEAFLDRHLDEIAGPTDPEERRMEVILGLVEDHFDVDREDLLSKRKTKVLSIPRGLVVYLLREHGGQTFKEIGRRLGSRSHTSVYLMYKKYADIIPADPDLMAVVREAGRRLITAG
ncbi:MAG: hypothetical protein CL908_19900 [Deltaproteobacteria bacterium]|nr:hypothetical protein [Deltaproteobacteria bacterium]